MGPDERTEMFDGEAREQTLPALVRRPTPVPRSAAAVAFPPRPRSGPRPALQAAVVAGSFVAGAAAAGLMRRQKRPAQAVAGRRMARSLMRRGTQRPVVGPQLVEIVASRSLLVDVHLLGLPTPER